MKKLLTISTLVAFLSLTALAAPYALDAAKSKVDFQIYHLKLSAVDGSFDKFEAVIDYDVASNKLNTFEGKVAVASVDTANQKRDEHLRAEDIFNIKKYPNMTFKMTKFENGKIYGDLTIKGKTKAVVLDSTIKNNGNILEILANTKVKRSDFNVVWESNLRDSLVSDELEVKLTLVATPK
ncbi:polyisoprenoid-binding protein [Helicobacter apodemus]|uniref:Polyisoprenoid-binding protein n=1 Tax=Helicobacter apodemus TaxID=135569 RepID=A0A4U8UFY8_9HELI|nr:YceI family protein [Helicobacter apodemus]MDE6957933.1 YceI family protein [Helicobacter apodemus]TLE16208.1 polyisoprenoid-binding protein [Helicobacter apodemus]